MFSQVCFVSFQLIMPQPQFKIAMCLLRRIKLVTEKNKIKIITLNVRLARVCPEECKLLQNKMFIIYASRMEYEFSGQDQKM